MLYRKRHLDNRKDTRQERKRMDSNTKLTDYIGEWLTTFKLNSVKPATYDRLLTSLNALDRYGIKDMPISKITPFDLQDYVNELKDDFSSMSTVKKQIRIVTSPLRHAASLRLIPSDPTVGLKLPSSSCFEEKDVQAYTKEEQEKLSAVAKTYRYPGWAAVLLMIETGMRVGEALALRWRDVQIFNKRLYVNATVIRLANKNASRIQDSPKSKSSRRVIPLTNLAIKILEHQKMVSPGNFVFSDQNGNNLSYEALRYQVQKLASEAGVSYMGMHVFRHTFATNCYYKGVDVKILSRLLGHSNPSVTLNVYIHLYGDGFEEMYNAITS